MSIRRLVARWQGVVLVLVGLTATIWLGITGQLVLYIHPRYIVFTIIMAVIAAVLALAAFVLAPAAEDGHDHGGHDDTAAAGSWRRMLPTAVSIVTVVVAAVGLLVLPPATLTTATVSQRDLNGSASALTLKEPAVPGKGDYSAFTVRDWASLLRSGAGLDFFADKPATVTGFVTPDKNDPDVFFVTRFVVTCCAVDAQPIGVPVYHPGWQNDFKADSWVTVSSTFRANPNPAGQESIVLIPDVITPTTQPAQPYVY
ncbi:MAG TPA: TIGR03943 family protein [Paenarthrobacter sp.]|nr:TIGR03943 family protein [Paenarthrobacter sp.]